MRASTQEILGYGIGLFGGAISTGQALTGEFVRVDALNDVTISGISGSLSGISALDGGAVTIKAGGSLFGKFTYVQPASGTIAAYYA